ncbi:hypothetical protein GCM10009007_21130 [Formosimonas limnophila]|uniref:Uncharacterized protein n=1 Tax=Formosimonas limnophila TaxID=1384487 RepID=A0A8J3G0I4_9BURK|nr:hypothetical protein GCM10009007_21130 [Formosimonas limnophila]
MWAYVASLNENLDFKQTMLMLDETKQMVELNQLSKCQSILESDLRVTLRKHMILN